MFCVVCQDDVLVDDVQDALECLQCMQGLHEACYNDYSEKTEEKREDGIVPCPSCRNTVTMQAVKHREWAALLNVIHAIRQRSDAGLLTDVPTAAEVLSGILRSTSHSSIVVTYVCKCLYAISLGKDYGQFVLPHGAAICIVRCLATHPFDDELGLWACAAFYTLSKNADNEVVCAFSAIVACMQAHKETVIISYYAAMTFRTCLVSDFTSANELVRVAVRPCLDALNYHGSPLISKAVSWLILSLALLPSQKTALGTLGCLQALCTVVANHVDNDEIMTYATSALTNLLCGSCENKGIACDIGMIRVALEIFRRTSLPRIIVEACDIVSCLVRTRRSDVICELDHGDGIAKVWEVWSRNECNVDIVKACMKTMLAFNYGGVQFFQHTNEILRAACRALLRFTDVQDARTIKTAFKVIQVTAVLWKPAGEGERESAEAVSVLTFLDTVSKYAKRDEVQELVCETLTLLFRTDILHWAPDACEAAVDTALSLCFESCCPASDHLFALRLLRATLIAAGDGGKHAFRRPRPLTALYDTRLLSPLCGRYHITESALSVVSCVNGIQDFSDMLQRFKDDAVFCCSLCTVLHRRLYVEMPAANISESLLPVLVTVLHAHAGNLDVAAMAACCLVCLGDVYDAWFYTNDVSTLISRVYDTYPTDATLFMCVQRAFAIDSGRLFTRSVLRTCVRVL